MLGWHPDVYHYRNKTSPCTRHKMSNHLWSKQLFLGIHRTHHGLQAACSLENCGRGDWVTGGDSFKVQPELPMLRFISCFVQLVRVWGEIKDSDLHFSSHSTSHPRYKAALITSRWKNNIHIHQGQVDWWHHLPSREKISLTSVFFSCPLQLRNKRAGGVGKDGSFSLLVKHLDKNLYQQILILAMISWGNGWWRLSPAIANNPTNY